MDNQHISTHTKGSYSAMDLSICSQINATDFTWSVSNFLYSSDHYPQVIAPISPATPFYGWNFNKANWSAFKDNVDLSQALNIDDIEEMNNIITNKIVTTASLFIPKYSTTTQKRRLPWWNDTCAAAIKSKNQAFVQYKTFPHKKT